MKRKRLWSIFFVFLLICIAFFSTDTTVAAAEQGSCGDLTWSISDAGSLTISGNGAMPDYTSDIKQLPWYEHIESITSISIGDSVTHIGNYAFAGCVYVKTLTIGSGVKTIGEGAFMLCASLTKVTVPASVTTIEDGAFAYCESMTTCTYSTSAKLTRIGQSAFAYCSALTRVKLPTSMVTIGPGAYMYCSALKELYIQTGVTTIGQSAFAYCSALTTVTIPATVEIIEDGAFAYCEKLVTCTYSTNAKLTSIGQSAFAYCASLTRVKLPASVRTIAPMAYAYCESLGSLTIPSGLTTIGDGAFGYCKSLTSVTIPASVSMIGEYPFYYCTSLSMITVSTSNAYFTSNSGVLFNKDKTSLIQAPGALTGSYTVPNSVVTICAGAFGGCAKVTAMNLGTGLERIGEDAFSGCVKLTKMVFNGNAPIIEINAFYNVDVTATYYLINKGWDTISNTGYGGHIKWLSMYSPTVYAKGVCGDNVTWELSTSGKMTISGTGPMYDVEYASELPWWKYNKEIKTASISEGVTHIGANTFYGCEFMTSCPIPESVTSIGAGAFTFCRLKTFTLPKNLTYIGGGAFSENIYLTSITIPNGVTEIGGNAFGHCTALTSVKLPTSLTAISDGLFKYCSSLKTVTIPFGVNSIGIFAFERCTALTKITIPGSVTSIELEAFKGCTGLTSVTLEEGLVRIGTKAFASCPIQKVVIPNSVTTIEESAFAGCKELTSVTLGNGLSRIEKYAFSSCTKLTAIAIPDSVRTIGAYAFYNSDLDVVTFGSGLEVIEEYAFRNCMGIRELKLPDSLKTIGDYAFYNCYMIASLTIPDGVTHIGAHAFNNLRTLESLTLGKRLTTIGDRAFYYCYHLKSVTIPAGVTSIGANIFDGCEELTEITFEGSAPTIGANAFVDVTATAYYNGNASWTEEVRQSYGGTITWVAYESTIVQMSDGAYYDTFAEALKHYDSAAAYIILHNDITIDVELAQDLYVDLAGYSLSGTIKTNGYKIYGMDATTNTYTCDSVGYFSCTDAGGNAVVPETHFKSSITGSVKRYMTVNTDEGYSFHRIYLAVTHMSLRPAVTSVGFKAAFYGDSMVVAALDQTQAFGYTMVLGGNTPFAAYKGAESFVSGKTVTLRIDNYDIENYGETELTASVMLKLQDGTVIQSSESTMTMRGMIEQLNGDPSQLTDVQKNNILALIKKNPIMKTWDIQNFYDDQSEQMEEIL